MNKNIAVNKFSDYLKSYNIKFWRDLDLGVVRFTMQYSGFENVPGSSIESCIWWYDEAAEVRVYFNATASKFCKEHPENHLALYRLFNFINARIWLKGSDFCGGRLYKPAYLYDPRIYMTEDGSCDITMTFTLPYDFYEVAPLESEDFITATLPDLLNHIAPAIFFVILGKWDVKEAISFLNTQVIK
ncbi:MAG: hypothetical protein QM214_00015 [Bacillota bacterium]|jgi:hypothetical protein|nr:hypothetical protein [Bacillota bacterium]